MTKLAAAAAAAVVFCRAGRADRKLSLTGLLRTCLARRWVLPEPVLPCSVQGHAYQGSSVPRPPKLAETALNPPYEASEFLLHGPERERETTLGVRQAWRAGS